MTKQEVIRQAIRMDEKQSQQTLNDAEACRESRRVSRLANLCDCFCCQYARIFGSSCHD